MICQTCPHHALDTIVRVSCKAGRPAPKLVPPPGFEHMRPALSPPSLLLEAPVSAAEPPQAAPAPDAATSAASSAPQPAEAAPQTAEPGGAKLGGDGARSLLLGGLLPLLGCMQPAWSGAPRAAAASQAAPASSRAVQHLTGLGLGSQQPCVGPPAATHASASLSKVRSYVAPVLCIVSDTYIMSHGGKYCVACQTLLANIQYQS